MQIQLTMYLKNTFSKFNLNHKNCIYVYYCNILLLTYKFEMKINCNGVYIKRKLRFMPIHKLRKYGRPVKIFYRNEVLLNAIYFYMERKLAFKKHQIELKPVINVFLKLLHKIPRIKIEQCDYE